MKQSCSDLHQEKPLHQPNAWSPAVLDLEDPDKETMLLFSFDIINFLL